MTPRKVLILGTIAPEATALFDEKENFTYQMITESLTEKELSRELSLHDAFLVRDQKISADVFQETKTLKVVSRHGVGVDNLDIPTLSGKQIPLYIIGPLNSFTVAEHAIALMMNLAKKILFFNQAVRQSNWNYRKSIFTSDLYQKTCLILGLGKIGKEIMKRLQAFEMKIMSYDPFVSDEEMQKQKVLPVTDLSQALPESDFVLICLPKTEQTKSIISAKELKNMKKTAYLINTSRGELVDEKDLYHALKNQEIAGAGFDVLGQEPPDMKNPLFNLDNFIITPHVAALSKECYIRMGQSAVQNIIDYFEGNLNRDRVFNPEVFECTGWLSKFQARNL